MQPELGTTSQDIMILNLSSDVDISAVLSEALDVAIASAQKCNTAVAVLSFSEACIFHSFDITARDHRV